jgi:hypothetical protein
MSVRVMTLVFRESESTGAARLVLLALADVASEDGEVTAYKRSYSTLATKAKVNASTVRKAIRSLEELSELRVVTVGIGRTKADYQIELPGLRVGDTPTLSSPDAQSGVGERPTQSAPEAQSITTSLSVVGNTSSDVADPPQEFPSFDEFWDAYPKRRGQTRGPKDQARKSWERLDPLDRCAALRGAVNYAAGQDHQFVRDAVRFLRDRTFDDWLALPDKPMTVTEKWLAQRKAAANGQ